jgi:hypothetical protein
MMNFTNAGAPLRMIHRVTSGSESEHRYWQTRPNPKMMFHAATVAARIRQFAKKPSRACKSFVYPARPPNSDTQ